MNGWEKKSNNIFLLVNISNRYHSKRSSITIAILPQCKYWHTWWMLFPAAGLKLEHIHRFYFSLVGQLQGVIFLKHTSGHPPNPPNKSTYYPSIKCWGSWGWRLFEECILCWKMTWSMLPLFNEWVLHEASFKSNNSNFWRVWKLEIEWTEPFLAAKVQYQYEVLSVLSLVSVINPMLMKLFNCKHANI